MGKAQVEIPHTELARFCRRNRISRLSFFGSILTEAFRPDSDIDVLVVFEHGAQVGFLDLGRMKRELETLLRRPVDLVIQSGLKPLIRDQVLASAEVIYAA
ncbi:MAG: nucleotidyltransferase [Chloroflexi bacterium]|nr:nucleotidyltransferase [Chloroflexota bacterium]